MIPEKIQSFRKILERNNLITVLCLLLVLVSFILNYLERRETLGKQLEFSYYVTEKLFRHGMPSAGIISRSRFAITWPCSSMIGMP